MPPEISISEAGGGMLFDMVIAFHHVACPVFLRIKTVARASPDWMLGVIRLVTLTAVTV